MAASMKGHEEVVDRLIQHEAIVDLQKKVNFVKGSDLTFTNLQLL